MTGSSADLVADYWAQDRKGPRPLSWLEHPLIEEYVNRRVTGDPHKSTYQWFKDAYIPSRLQQCLMIGCGHGRLERDLIRIGVSERFDASDISPGAIELARAGAEADGFGDRISYSVADMNHDVLPTGTYDAIFIVSAAHHIARLEHLFDQCRSALKPGGLLFLDEYVGPNRFQTKPKTTMIINRFLRALPRRYRENHLSGPRRFVEQYVPVPPEHFEATDPSEAIRSADILAELSKRFHIVDRRAYGGAVLHMLLSGIVGNFDPQSEGDRAVLDMLTVFEATLERWGAIESDFAAVVARPRA